MTKRTGINEMWNRLDRKERLHFKTKYLVDLCECAKEDGRREGRLEAYKEMLKEATIVNDLDIDALIAFLTGKIKELEAVRNE